MLRELDFVDSDWDALLWALGSGKYDGSVQAFRASSVESAARKVLWSGGIGDAEQHRKEDRRNAMGSGHRQRRVDHLCPGSVARGARSFSRVAIGTRTVSRMARHCWHPGRWIHDRGMRPMAKKRSKAAGILLAAMTLITHAIFHAVTHR